MSVFFSGALHVAGAQQPPARLPAVVVTGAPDLPGAKKIAGVVRDTSAIPVDGAEISIPGLQQRAFSSADGSFHFENVPPGQYSVRARKLGYAPQIRPILVDKQGGVGMFTLLPLQRALPPMIVSVARGGLSGVVGDTAFNPLTGADVRVLGHGESTRTDSLGRFYIPVRPGTYIVTVKQPGFDYKMVSVVVPQDSGRRITVFLPPQSRVPTHREANNLIDLESRLAWRTQAHSRVYTHAELEEMHIEWAYDAVNLAWGALCPGYHVCRADEDCSVIVNGGPATATLGSLTVDEIETMEVYAGTYAPPTGGRGRGFAKPAPAPTMLSNSSLARSENATKFCLTTYVWLR
jgi:hypothetical protein